MRVCVPVENKIANKILRRRNLGTPLNFVPLANPNKASRNGDDHNYSAPDQTPQKIC